MCLIKPIADWPNKTMSSFTREIATLDVLWQILKYLWGFLTPPVAGADLRAALVASCLRGALPPVDLRAVCLVRAMVANLFRNVTFELKYLRPSHQYPPLMCGWISNVNVKQQSQIREASPCKTSRTPFWHEVRLLAQNRFAMCIVCAR
jgi:hypothetical protein